MEVSARKPVAGAEAGRPHSHEGGTGKILDTDQSGRIAIPFSFSAFKSREACKTFRHSGGAWLVRTRSIDGIPP
jgi:hypothetical protein